MTKLHDIARPGILLTEIAPEISGKDGETLRAIEMTLQTEFFSSVQTARVQDSGERKQIGEMVASVGVTLTYCASIFQYEQNLDLSALDQGTRKSAVDAFLQIIDEAREQKTNYLMLISGLVPKNPVYRLDALKVLRHSLDTLCRAAAETPPVTILIEPLDVTVHKKRVLGYTNEAVELARTLCIEHDNFGLCLDTSHMILNCEDPVEALRLGQDYSRELHICNCCLDSAHPLYGDQHIPLGPPGPLDLQEFARILKQAQTMGFLCPEKRPGVFHEIRNQTMALKDAIQSNIDVLTTAWEMAQAGKNT